MINFKIILNVLGYLLIALSLVMLIPMIIDLGMGNNTWKSFITSAIITFGFGVTFLISTRNEENNKILMQDAFLITSLSCSKEKRNLPIYGRSEIKEINIDKKLN